MSADGAINLLDDFLWAGLDHIADLIGPSDLGSIELEGPHDQVFEGLTGRPVWRLSRLDR